MARKTLTKQVQELNIELQENYRERKELADMVQTIRIALDCSSSFILLEIGIMKGKMSVIDAQSGRVALAEELYAKLPAIIKKILKKPKQAKK